MRPACLRATRSANSRTQGTGCRLHSAAMPGSAAARRGSASTIRAVLGSRLTTRSSARRRPATRKDDQAGHRHLFSGNVIHHHPHRPGLRLRMQRDHPVRQFPPGDPHPARPRRARGELRLRFQLRPAERGWRSGPCRGSRRHTRAGGGLRHASPATTSNALAQGSTRTSSCTARPSATRKVASSNLGARSRCRMLLDTPQGSVGAPNTFVSIALLPFKS